MKKDTAAYGYDKCLKWCENEAATRRSLEKALSNQKNLKLNLIWIFILSVITGGGDFCVGEDG